jgi:hypothetical protein
MTTPTETALARRWRLEINMGDETTPDWQMCPGIVSFSWSAEPNHEEYGEYEADGWAGNAKTGQAWEVVAGFNRKVTPDQTAYAPVHEAIRTAFFAYGAASRVHLRFMDRKGLPEAYEGYGLPNWEPQNDEHTDLDQVEVTFTGDGPLETITNPMLGG